VGYNDTEAEKQYQYREEADWPIPRTVYTKYYLTASKELTEEVQKSSEISALSYKALGTIKHPEFLQFVTQPFDQESEFTGHISVHLNVSVSASPERQTPPSDLDLFITLRHLDAEGREIYYTGTVGDPVPVTKGWLRVSLRKTADGHPQNKPWHPHREYYSTDVLPVEAGEVYDADVEVWPTNVVVSPGNRLVLEVSSGDTQGAGLFEHTSDVDRPREVFEGMNHIHFGSGLDNWVMMPFIPTRG
jgi:predicted acyl esterase